MFHCLVLSIAVSLSWLALVEPLAIRHPRPDQAIPARLKTPSAIPAASQMRPSPQPALLAADVDVSSLFKQDRLVTDESVVAQVGFNRLAIEHWHRLARVPSAPFSQTRSGPLLI